MMIYRCTACTRDHYTSQQPAICAGCSLPAGGFALIHLAEVVEEGEPFSVPPPPRDLPADRDEAFDRLDVVPKAHGVCSQVTCDAPATHRFTWPGQPEAGACHEHALKAVHLAEHMGFFLEAPALDAPRPS